MVEKFIYHQDPGHGWVEVPQALIDDLGIRPKISWYSYEDPKAAYLEEDLDAGVFIEAMKAAGLEYEIVSKHIDDDHPIRFKKPFNPKKGLKIKIEELPSLNEVAEAMAKQAPPLMAANNQWDLNGKLRKAVR